MRSFGYDLTVTAGQAVVLPPYRQAQHTPLRQPLRITEAGFHVEPFLSGINPLSHLGLPVVVTIRDLTSHRDWCRQLEACFQKYRPVSDTTAVTAPHWLGLLLVNYLDSGFQDRAFATAQAGPVPPWLQALRDELASRPPRAPLDLRELQRRSGYSRSHINAEFKRHFGLTPRACWERRRLEHAMQWLSSNSEMSIAEIAEKCGYSTQSLFNRHFRQLTGKAPGAFRHAVLQARAS